MKQISTVFTALIALLLVSCNNQPKPAEEKPKEEVVKPAETKPVFTPYKSRLVEITVKDFDKWYSAFNASDSLRKAHGLMETLVGKEMDNDKKIIVFSTIPDIGKAKEFDASQDRKDFMKKSGTVSVTTPTYWNVIMDDTSKIPQNERLMVNHHVKDFDVWKKAYDAEGAATRASNGMVERAMARGIDDPNMVSILFAVTDMAKAKARATSPELKKIMTDAGVDGPPQITWFKWVNLN